LAYKVVWHERALDDLGALDRTTAKKIVERIKNYLSQDPEKLGKPLKGVLQGLFRYRWGDYRILFTVDKSESRISILFIGHRKNVYSFDRRP
jgi:mRNA interferase RelE/StbE